MEVKDSSSMEVKSLHDVAKFLEQSRMRQGLTKDSLAKYAGVSKPTIFKVMKVRPPEENYGYEIESLLKITRAIGVKIVLVAEPEL